MNGEDLGQRPVHKLRDKLEGNLMANRNFANAGKIYNMHVMPVEIDMRFTVDATNGSGITGLKGPLVQAVYMATATTKTTGSPGGTTGPADGTIVVRLQDNYSGLFALSSSISSPAGTPIKIDNSAMTAGVAYTITTLGDATAAKWRAIGVPAGITPAVGVAFIAATNGGAGNVLTSRVAPMAAAGSGVASIEIVRNSQLSLAEAPSANMGYGAELILQCRDYAGALVAPVAGSVIHIRVLLSNSSIQIAGE